VNVKERVRSPSTAPIGKEKMKAKNPNNVKCCGCQKELVNEEDFYGSYVVDYLVDGVCLDCYAKGVRTKGQKKLQLEGVIA
jgi:hypothetical protein